jgi:glucokinase
MSEGDFVIGIDLGATKIGLGVIDPQNQIILRDRLPTNAVDGPESAVKRTVASIEQLRAQLPAGQRVSAVGICSPGPIDHESGMIIDPPNLTGWRNVPFRQMLADRLDKPVVLEHDAKAAALGESYYGVGQGARSMVYIVVGTGVGAAIIIDGKLYRGMHNYAGEIGHMTIDYNAPMFEAGVRGAVQDYCRGPALAREYTRLIREEKPNAAVEDVTGASVAIAATNGDPVAVHVLERAGQALGIAIASMGLVLDIELYVIGGSVIKAGELLLNSTRQAVPRFCVGSIAETVRIEPAALGDDGPLMGCAYLARSIL